MLGIPAVRSKGLHTVINNSKPAVAMRRIRPSISACLLLAVNLPLAVALAVLLPLDYRREMEGAITQKHAALEEEAMAMYFGLSGLAQAGRPQSVQRYIDAVCARMQASRSPGHHIAVRRGGNLYQAEAHQRESSEIVRAMQRAASSSSHRAPVDDETLVVGSFSKNGLEVYVSEYTTNIRRAIRREILVHVGMLAALAIAAAAIVNIVLWKIVVRPVQQLSNKVFRIAGGDYDVKAAPFRSRELDALSGAIQRMTERLAANQRERAAQLDRARRIQQRLLPNGVTIPGLDVARVFEPAEAVAGDYYDMIRLRDGTWLICVADVSGHGVAAAMGSAMLKSLVMRATEQHREPRRILKFVNDRLPGLLDEELVTMFLARWDPGSHRLEYASAGHEPGILLSPSGEVVELHATGFPLGVDGAADWGTDEIQLVSGQRLLVTTDGIAEASDPDGDLFGRKQLTEHASACAGLSAGQTVESIQDAVRRHEAAARRTDDRTILLVEVTTKVASRSKVSPSTGFGSAPRDGISAIETETHG